MKRAILLVESNDAESKAAVLEVARIGERELVEATEEDACRSLAARLHEIALVIMDLSPGQPAVDLLRTIALSATNPPVIVIAGPEQLGAVPVARKCGASACIRKPFTAEKLTSVIDELSAIESTEQSWTCDVWGHPHRRLIRISE